MSLINRTLKLTILNLTLSERFLFYPQIKSNDLSNSGTIKSGSALSINSKKINNKNRSLEGRIEGSAISLQGEELVNEGLLLSESSIDQISSFRSLRNSGKIAAQKINLTKNLDIVNDGGVISGSMGVLLDSANLLNRNGGKIQSRGKVGISSLNSIRNDVDSSIISGNDEILLSSDIIENKGKIESKKKLDISDNVDTLSNYGSIKSSDDIKIAILPHTFS